MYSNLLFEDKEYIETINNLLDRAKKYQSTKDYSPIELFELYNFAFGLTQNLVNENQKKIISDKITLETTKELKFFCLTKLNIRNSYLLENLGDKLKFWGDELKKLRIKNESIQILYLNIIKYAFDIMELNSNDCCIVTLGSLASGQATSYSDLEYLTLVKDYSAKNQKDFNNLSVLISLIILNFGETPVKINNLALSNFQKYFHCIKEGVRTDEWKTPGKNNWMFELVFTDSQLLETPTKRDYTIHKYGNHTTAALLTTNYLFGNKEIYQLFLTSFNDAFTTTEYKDSLCRLLDEDIDLLRNLYNEILINKKNPSYEINLKRIMSAGINLSRLIVLSLKTMSPKTRIDANHNIMIEELKNCPGLNEQEYQTWCALISKLINYRKDLQIVYKRANVQITLEILENGFEIDRVLENLNIIRKIAEAQSQKLKETKISRRLSQMLNKLSKRNPMPNTEVDEEFFKLINVLTPEESGHTAEQLSLYVPPFCCHTEKNPKEISETNEDFPLLKDVVNDFFTNGKEKILLLKGGAGSGKSLFGYYLKKRFRESFKCSVDPVFIFISLPQLKNPIENLINEYFEGKFGTGNAIRIINKLKRMPNVYFFLDAVDEIPLFQKNPESFRNIFESNRLSEWEQAKFIISCRTDYLNRLSGLSDTGSYEKHFMPIEGDRFQHQSLQVIQLALFSRNQINSYIEEYAKKHPNNEDISLAWSAKKYKDEIEKLSNIQALIRSPLLLKMTVQALPTIVSWYSATKEANPDCHVMVTERDIYLAYLKDNLERQDTKLVKSLGENKVPANIKIKFLEFIFNLANKMVENKTSRVIYEFRNNDGIQDGEKWAKPFFGDPFDGKDEVKLGALEMIRNNLTCFLAYEDNTWRFVHDSFLGKYDSVNSTELSKIEAKLMTQYTKQIARRKSIEEFAKVLFSHKEGPYYLSGKNQWNAFNERKDQEQKLTKSPTATIEIMNPENVTLLHQYQSHHPKFHDNNGALTHQPSLK